MPTLHQKQQLMHKLKIYKKKYLRKQYADLDESATRLMVNSFLTDVLGYKELDEIKTEYRIKGEYADYVIQLARKKHFVVEVKSIQLDITEKHLRQSLNYAANEGIEWILLLNGKHVELYRVIFAKPIECKKVFGFDLSDEAQFKKSINFIIYLTKKSILKNELENFWRRFEALSPQNLCKNLYAVEVVRFLRRVLKQKTDLYFRDEDILESLHDIIITKLESVKPKIPLTILKKRNSENALSPH